jgi:RNA polymerase sigma-70 factor (ECF subfamily)
VARLSVEDLAPGFDEHVVVEAAKAGQADALAVLYEFYLPRVYRYVAARLGGGEDAEDVTEEIFLKVINHIGSFSWRGLPFGAWVFRIARNEVVSHVRRQRYRGSHSQLSESLPDFSQDHVAEVERASQLDIVREAAERLPDAQRQVIALRFGSGLSVAETAAALGKSENNVKVLQHKAIAKLQKMVGGQ